MDIPKTSGRAIVGGPPPPSKTISGSGAAVPSLKRNGVSILITDDLHFEAPHSLHHCSIELVECHHETYGAARDTKKYYGCALHVQHCRRVVHETHVENSRQYEGCMCVRVLEIATHARAKETQIHTSGVQETHARERREENKQNRVSLTCVYRSVCAVMLDEELRFDNRRG